ncbi:MAG TPA: hypothetical protein VFU71_07395 [Burkholderiaceae bacterium]|nr:hypothetical protein [Burkholderiaceae bacterium]
MRRRILFAAALAATTAATRAAKKQPVTADTSSTRRQPTLADAQQAYYSGQFGRSLQLYEALAAQNNAEAAECAGFMLLMGESMYGPQVHRDVERAKELLVEAARGGRSAAGFLLNMIERTD